MSRWKRRGLIGVSMVVLVSVSGAVAWSLAGARGGRAPTLPRLRATPSSGMLNASAVRAQPTSSSVARSQRSLGAQAIVNISPLTGQPQSIAKQGGYLTGRSRRSAGTIVRGYIDSHRRLFGVNRGDVSSLRVSQQRTSGAGGLHPAPPVTHVVMSQSVGGIPAVGADVTANVTATGRLLSIGGAPAPGLTLPSTTPALDAQDALRAARRDVNDARPAPAPLATSGSPTRQATFPLGDRAALVAWAGDGPARLAWRVLFTDRKSRLYDSILDARTGTVIRRNSLTDSADAATVFSHYPGATNGGAQQTVDLTPYLDPGATTLSGPFAHAYSDVNTDNVAESTEEVSPSGGDFVFARTPFTPAGQTCPPAPTGCDWDPATGGSWQTNRTEDATQVFWFVNHYHDHLASDPIDFTAAKGAFEGLANRVNAEDLDGANGPGGLPDTNHINNANMSTPPRGGNPRMQMYLFKPPFQAIDGGASAEIVYHEYTHGLTNRLVVDSQGVSTLTGEASRSLGEAWSDWYALDYLVTQGLLTDTAANGEIFMGGYTDGPSQYVIRSEPIDCPVGSTAPACPGTPAAGAGGYTLGDMGRIVAGAGAGAVDLSPEVHADGEIWGQTLWDLRERMLALHPDTGVQRTELLVTRALELSVENPSFIDMRNAILQADTAFLGGADRDAIWSVFAQRGMGFYASMEGGGDFHPIQDFSLPPTAGGPSGTVTGTVTDADNGTPVPGIRVRVGGVDPSTGLSYTGVTGANGQYTITGVPTGTYPDVQTDDSGAYPSQGTGAVTVAPSATATRDIALQRNWAASAAGGRAIPGSGPNYTNCGPLQLIDGNLHSGWGTNPPAADNFMFVQLPRQIDITKISIDPTSRCAGQAVNNSLGAYTLYTSTDGGTFTPINSGTFTSANDGHFNDITVSASNVRYIALEADGSQGGGFAITSELQAFGVPTGSTGLASVRTDSADAVGDTQATLHATIDPGNQNATAFFQYSIAGVPQQIAAGTVTAGAGPTSVSVTVPGLDSETVYRYRVGATNTSGTAFGLSKTFTTTAPPVATTGGATDVTHTGATLHGTIDGGTSDAQSHFEYGPTNSYGSVTPDSPASAGLAGQAVSATLSGLPPSGTYHYRLVATDGTHTVHGADQAFNPLDQAPTATVGLDDHSPRTAQTLTATATRADGDGDPVSLRYVWKVNGVAKRDVTKSAGTNADLTDSFDLSVAGNGDRGDTVSVEVTPDDGVLTGTAATDSATVADTAPTAINDSGSTMQGSALNVSAPGVLANDGDADGDALSASKVGGPAHGAVALSADGSYTYTPTLGYAGPDSFTYRDSDGTLSSNVATVSLTVTAKADTTTSISSDSPDPSFVGQAVTVSYAVSSPGAGTPTGNVTVSDGTDSCTGTVAAGECSISFASAGGKSLTASYGGDANFNSSSSSPVTAHGVYGSDTVSVGATPTGVAVAATKAYVTNLGSNSVSVIDLTQSPPAQATTIPVGGMPDSAALSADGSRLYVANFKDGTLSIITTATSTVADTVAVGSRPTGVAEVGNSVYVANLLSGTISVIDPVAGSVTGTISLPGAGTATGAAPSGLAASGDGHTLYVNDARNGRTYAIDLTQNPPAVAGFAAVGSHPAYLSMTGSTGYVANPGSDSISVLDLSKSPPVTSGSVTVGSRPYGVLSVPSSNEVFATDAGSNNLSVIDITAAPTVAAVIPTGNLPDAIAQSPDQQTVVVSNEGDGTVTVFQVNPATAATVLGTQTPTYNATTSVHNPLTSSMTKQNATAERKSVARTVNAMRAVARGTLGLVAGARSWSRARSRSPISACGRRSASRPRPGARGIKRRGDFPAGRDSGSGLARSARTPHRAGPCARPGR